MPPRPKLNRCAFCRISVVGQVYAKFMSMEQYPDAFDTFHVRVFDVPLERERDSNNPGAVTSIVDITFDPKIFVSPDRLDGPGVIIMVMAEDPRLVGTIVVAITDHGVVVSTREVDDSSSLTVSEGVNALVLNASHGSACLERC